MPIEKAQAAEPVPWSRQEENPATRGFLASSAVTSGRRGAARRALAGTNSGGRLAPSSAGSRRKGQDASRVHSRPRLKRQAMAANGISEAGTAPASKETTANGQAAATANNFASVEKLPRFDRIQGNRRAIRS